jgi:DNA polymerase elongation subunit (family B)
LQKHGKVNGDTDQYTGAEIYDTVFLQNNPWAISANGTIFRCDTKGVVPNLLERWYAERKEMQKNLQNAIDTGDKEKIEFWDKRQLVKKINLNSLYGATALSSFRYGNRTLSKSITLSGQRIIQESALCANRSMNKEIKGELC